jgi:hypothetical protein
MEHAAPQDPHHTFLARASSLSVEQLRALVATFHVKIYGDDVWVVDRREPAAPLDAYALEEREPWPWEWYFISGVEPMRKYVPDPYSTWEWRTTFDQPPPAVDVPPKSFEQIRIAYNMAIAADDKNRARELRARIEEGMTRIPGANFTQGLTLLGYRRIGGTEPRIVNIFEATGTAARTDAMFAISAQVERSKPFSLIPPDPIVRAVSLTPALSTKLYRPGFIYANTVVLRQRIGIERFWGVFQSKDGAPPPTRVDGQAETPLLVAK